MGQVAARRLSVFEIAQPADARNDLADLEPDSTDPRISSVSSDSEIIARSTNEPEVFSEIFERHAAAVGGFARRRVGLDAVDDVLSETFVIAFRRRASFDVTATSARPWLFGIATRVIHRYRKTEEQQWRAQAASGGEEATIADENRTDAHLDAASALRQLGPRIAGLSQKERDVLLLHAWADLTYEQIATALKIPVGTVRSRLNRVRQKLTIPGTADAAPIAWTSEEERNANASARP